MKQKGQKALLMFLLVMGIGTLLSRSLGYLMMPKVVLSKPESIFSQSNQQYYHGMIQQSAVIGQDTVFYVEEEPGFWGVALIARKASVSLGHQEEGLVQIQNPEICSQRIIIAWDRPLKAGDVVIEALE